MNRHSRLKVRQAEVHPAIPAECRTQQREQRLVLIDGQKLPVAKRPTLGREAEGHDSDLRQKRFGHSISSYQRCSNTDLQASSSSPTPGRFIAGRRGRPQPTAIVISSNVGGTSTQLSLSVSLN